MTDSLLSGTASTQRGPRLMKAMCINRFGPPEVIEMEDVERPAPGPGEILVKVAAAGVGPWDAWIRAGKSIVPQPLPLTLGSDLSGTVEAVGPDVTAFAPGDDVFGVTNARFTGAYAQFAVAAAGMIAKKPVRLSDVDAASVPVVAVTAWQALFDHAGLAAGQTVLIHGAAGNVGTYAVQIAHRSGLHVVATAGTKDLAFVRGLGADKVIDYRAGRFEEEVREVDAVLDLVGGETQMRSFAALKKGGILVSAVSEPDQALAKRHELRALFFLVDVTIDALGRIATLIDAGRLCTQVGAVLPLAAARAAHEMLERTRAHPRGKIVLRIAG